MDDSLPSSYLDSPWLTHDNPNQTYPQADGKWMFFFPGHLIDRRWSTAKQLYNDGKLPQISAIKVSTAMPHATKSSGEHVLCFQCGPSADEDAMMSAGRMLVDWFAVQSYYVYYKSEQQSERSAAAAAAVRERSGASPLHDNSGNKERNYLYRLRRTPLTPIKMWNEDREDGEKSGRIQTAQFDLEKEEKGKNGAVPKSNGVHKSSKYSSNSKSSSTGNVFVFDTETTGFPPKAPPAEFAEWSRCRMMEIAWHVYTATGQLVAKREFLIKPTFTFELHPRVQEVHGISKEKAEKEGVELEFALDEMETALKEVDLLVGHNVKFDVGVVLSEIARTGRWDLFQQFQNLSTCCTMALGKEMMPSRTNQKLAVLYEELFEHPPVGVLHRADTDVLACAEVYFRLKSMVDEVDGEVLAEENSEPELILGNDEKEMAEEMTLLPVRLEPARWSLLQIMGLLVLGVALFGGWRRLLESFLV